MRNFLTSMFTSTLNRNQLNTERQSSDILFNQTKSASKHVTKKRERFLYLIVLVT